MTQAMIVKPLRQLFQLVLIGLCSVTASKVIAESTFGNELGFDLLSYTDGSIRSPQQNIFPALIVKPQWAWISESQEQQFVTQFFYLYDSVDQSRTHFDVREFYWLYQAETWEALVGINKVFWGVAESRNLVNIINQQDTAYGFDKSYRLGQPMIQGTWDQEEAGVISAYILPYFREQTLVGEKNPGYINATPQYQDSAKANHVDYAIRYANYIDDHEFAVSYFQGTDRIPAYLFLNGVGTALYRQAKQVGLEYQLSLDGWLWKFEGIHKSITDDTEFFASVFGFEYTLVGAIDEIDIGLLAEVNWDERGERSNDILQNDTFLATRFDFNDVDGSDITMGVSVDNNNFGQSWSIRGSKRFGNAWKAEVSSFFFALPDEDPLAQRLNNQDYLQLRLTYFY